jgi:hypothetical protein
MQSTNFNNNQHPFPSRLYSLIFILWRSHNFFSILHIEKAVLGFLVKFNRSVLKKYFRISNIAYNRAKKSDNRASRIIYPTAKSNLFRYRKLFSKLEGSDFFWDAETKKLSEDILSNYYKAESVLRYKAFLNDQGDEADCELTEFASKTSLHSLQGI